MKYKKSGTIIVLLLLLSTMGCVTPIPSSIKHCFNSGDWFQDHFSISFFNPHIELQCVEEVAIQEKNHRLCYHLNTSIDSICVQDYYEAINDSNVCNRELGGMENCIHYYYFKEKCHSQADLNQECVNNYIASVNRPDYCLSSQNEKECMTTYFTSKKDPTICNQLWDEYADACRQYYTINGQNRQ